MIILTEEQRTLICEQLSVAALRRLKKVGVDLAAPPPDPLADPAAALAILKEGDYVRDGEGFLWLAIRPTDREVWLAPFDDRMAFQIIAGEPARTHAVHPTSVPTFPLTRLDIP